MHLNKRDDRGFTLIELMVAMVVALLVLASIYQAYQTQQKAFSTQQLVVAMQQNARSAMTLMKREIRMAGYKPAASDGIDNDGDGFNGIDDAGENGLTSGLEIGIVQALKDQIEFRMDIAANDPDRCTNGLEDGGIGTIVDDPAECYDGLPDDPDEDITYALQVNAAGNGNDLVRISRWTDPVLGPQIETNILAYDIEAIAFGYAFDADEDGALDTDNGQPNGNVIWAYDSGAGDLDTDAQTGAALASSTALIGSDGPYIGAVRIWLLARTPHPIRGEVDTHTYLVGDRDFGPPGSGADVTYDPAYRRTLQVATVYCRNMRF